MREFIRSFTLTVVAAAGLAVLVSCGTVPPDLPCGGSGHMCVNNSARLDVSQVTDIRPQIEGGHTVG